MYQDVLRISQILQYYRALNDGDISSSFMADPDAIYSI